MEVRRAEESEPVQRGVDAFVRPAEGHRAVGRAVADRERQARGTVERDRPACCRQRHRVDRVVYVGDADLVAVARAEDLCRILSGSLGARYGVRRSFVALAVIIPVMMMVVVAAIANIAVLVIDGGHCHGLLGWPGSP